MAALKLEPKEVDPSETKSNHTNDTSQQKITIPVADQSIVDKLENDMAELYKYKCKHKINENGSVTFWPTPNCKPSGKRLPTTKLSMNRVLDSEQCKTAAAYSNPNDKLVDYGNQNACSFIVSALTAWSEHYPFRLRAEHIWLLILQSVAVHVEQNAEKLRDKYVTHEDKKTLIIEISASPSAKEWMSTIQGFVQKIDENTVKDTCELLDCDFTTSTLAERLATKVTIMDICKSYFEYRCRTMCGFPEVTLDGTKGDWIKLKQKTVQLLNDKVDKKFGAQWAEALLPLLNRFIVAFDGNIDCVFWNSMIKRGATHGSGAYRWYCGWFNILFPLLKGRWNRHCVPYSMDKSYVKQGFNANGTSRGHNAQCDFPMGLGTAPVTWDMNGTIIPLKFLAGFVGYKQDPKTLEIVPNVAWCVAYALTDKEIEDKKAKSKSGRKSKSGKYSR
eukprot:28614_1